MKEEYTWSAEEYRHREKTPDWFWALGILAVSTAVTALLFNNVLLALLILVGGFTLALYGARRPRKVSFRVDRRGVAVGDRLYPFGTLESYWLADEGHPEEALLIVRSKKLFMPYLVLPVPHAIAHDLARDLKEHLKNEELHEPISRRLMEFLGF